MGASMKTFSALVIAFFLAGCAATQTVRLAANTSLNFSGKQLHITRESPDPFLPLTYGNALFGAVGVIAAAGEGQSFIEKTSLKDPSHGLEDQLAEHVVTKYQLSGRGQTLDFTSSGAPSDVVSWSRKKNIDGLILDVETRGWGYSYDGFNTSDYFVHYTGRLKLTDLQSGKVIASHLCNKNTKTLQDGKVYAHDDLVANNAGLLKQLFGVLSQSCLNEFKTKAL